MATVTKRRFSSPAPKTAVSASSRQASPAATAKRASSSPVPSKCAVPGLVQATEENRRAAREPSIVVPSRYRQPSPAARRGSVSPAARRLSRGTASPGRTVGILRLPDVIFGSGRSIRKSWEDPGSCGTNGKHKVAGSRSKVDQKSILRTQIAISKRLSDAGLEPNSIEDSSTNAKQKPVNKTEPPSMSEKPNPIVTKVPVHDRKWTDGSIPFDAVSDNLEKLGKEALQRRNVASIAAAEALEEALAIESLIRSLSMFSDLSSSSKAENPLPTIDGFLSIYDDVMKWSAITKSLASSRITNGPTEATLTDRSKPASLWVEAALITDLKILSLVNADVFSMQKSVDEPSIIYVDPSRKNSLGTPSKKIVWTRGYELGETLNFAESLREEMQSWFLEFVEVSLDVGFRLLGGSLEDDEEYYGRLATVLSRLKRVNDWLDGEGKNAKKSEEDMKVVVEKIERLKRKIYGFVITHIGSSFDDSISLSKS